MILALLLCFANDSNLEMKFWNTWHAKWGEQLHSLDWKDNKYKFAARLSISLM